jgi:hypothetical protein
MVWSVCFLSVEAHRAVLFFAPFLHLLLQERYDFHSVVVAAAQQKSYSKHATAIF